MAVAAFTIITLADAQSCAVPANSLSFSCGTSCPATSACMLKTASSACDLECFSSSDNSFSFLIPFDETVGDTKTTASKSNDVLTKIPKLEVPSAITDVAIYGGSSISKSTRESVAKVQIAEDFLAGSTQLTLLRLANLNISTSISKLLPNFPSKLQQLYLTNDLLTEVPTGIARFKELDFLILSDNAISKFDQTHEINSLTTLRLDLNSLTSFTALYPKLTYLDLAYNQLTEVPTVISKYKHLTTLHLSGNKISEFAKEYALPTLDTLGLFSANLDKFDVDVMPNLVYLQLSSNNFKEIPPVIFSHSKLEELYLDNNELLTNVTLTNQQANFIATLKTFTIDANAFSTDCDTSQQAKVKGFTVCITGGAVDKSIIDGTRRPSTSAPSKSGGSSSSSYFIDIDLDDDDIGSDNADSSGSGRVLSTKGKTSMFVLGCVAGATVALACAGAVVWYQRRK